MAPSSRSRRLWLAAVVVSMVTGAAPLLAGSSEAAGDGGVVAWGSDIAGAVGDGEPRADQPAPVGVLGLGAGGDVVAVAGGRHHSLALRADGRVLAWGLDAQGQLGNGGPVLPPYAPGEVESASPVTVTGLGPGSGVVAVDGGDHSLALRADGSVLAWGDDHFGQLGDGGAKASRSTPVAVSGLGPGSGVVAVSAAGFHSLALLSDGSVLEWGDDVGPDNVDRVAPGPVRGLGPGSGVVDVSAGGHHSLALRSDGTVLAWGHDGSGQLGDGSPQSDRSTPGPVTGLGPGSGVVDVAGGGGHSLALRADGSVLAWGQDTEGEVGDGGPVTCCTSNEVETPVAVSGLGPGSGVVAVDGGSFHSLALRADGSVLAWGHDEYGQVGDGGTATDQSAPVPVAGLGAGSGATGVGAGGYHNLVARRGERQGYGMVAADGEVFRYGAARFWGSTRGIRLNQSVVDMAYTPSGNGYSLAASDGGIFGFGDFRFFGSTGGVRLNQPIVGMETTPSGNGYWLVASDGGIFAYGDARFLGSTGGIPLNRPVVGMERTPSGNGYWLVASDGGIFAYGDAGFHGSTGSFRLNRPIVAMSRTRSGGGYHFVADDGGVFAFGDAPFRGSTGGQRLNAPIAGIMATPSGDGYWLCGRDGGVFGFGGGRSWGSLGGSALTKPIVGCDAPRL